MELKRLLAIAGLLALASSAPAQTPPSTVNPLIPIAGQPVEQSGPALRQNFLATMNDINALYGRIVNGRTKLTAPLTLFADFVNGTNSTTCGLASGAAACKTVQAAYNNLVLNYDTGGQMVTISFNNNDTTGLAITTGWSGGGQVTIQGPGGSPPSIGLSGALNGVFVTTPLPAQLNLVGFKVSAPKDAVNVTAPGVKLTINNLNFAASGEAHIVAGASGSLIQCAGGYTISGSTLFHWNAAIGGTIFCQVAITLIGTPNFSVGFAVTQDAASIFTGGASFIGSATGNRYLAVMNSAIDTNSGNPNFLPGNAAGILATGGQYQ